jgi:hypothetical protein
LPGVCGSDHHRWCVAGTQAGPEKWMAQEEEVEQRTEPVAERSRTGDGPRQKHGGSSAGSRARPHARRPRRALGRLIRNWSLARIESPLLSFWHAARARSCPTRTRTFLSAPPTAPSTTPAATNSSTRPRSSKTAGLTSAPPPWYFILDKMLISPFFSDWCVLKFFNFEQ